MKKNVVTSLVLVLFFPLFVHSCLPSIENTFTAENLELLRPALVAKYCLDQKQTSCSMQGAEVDWIEEEPVLHIRSLVAHTITALATEPPDQDALEKLRESWTTMNELAYKNFNFTEIVEVNFARVKPFLADTHQIYRCLGFDSHREMTLDTTQARSKEILELFNILKDDGSSAPEEKVKNALELLKAKATTLYNSNLIYCPEWDKHTTPQSIDTSVLTPKILSNFKDALSPFLWAVRQTGYLTREPIRLRLLKSYCEGQKALSDTQDLYKSSIEDFRLNNDYGLFEKINEAICNKKINESPDNQEELIQELSGIHANVLGEYQPDDISTTAITFLSSWLPSFNSLQ